MKRSLLALWPSPKSLLHAIIHISLLCFFIALFVTLDHNTSHTLQSPLLSTQEFTRLQAPHKIIEKKPSLVVHTNHIQEKYEKIEGSSRALSSLTRRQKGVSVAAKEARIGNEEEDSVVEEITSQIQEKHEKVKASMVPSSTHRKKEDSIASKEARNPHSPSALGPKITDWNQQRQAWLATNADSAPTRHRSSKPSILLVTGSSPHACNNPDGDHYLLKFVKNKMDYCRLHGIEIFYSMAILDSKMDDCWSKLPLLRKLMLSHPEVEWLWWMDSDAMFTDMTFELPMEKYKEQNFVLHGWEDEVYEKKSWYGLNAGVFLIRNCQWSLDFMDEWATMGASKQARDEGGKVLADFLTNRPFFEADDQAVLIYLLNTQKGIWGSKVFLENSYCLHGYWEFLVDKYEEMMESSHAGYGDDRWPLVTHFVGCKPCGSGTNERCWKQMERAFYFGDNQVLQYYGFQHMHLSSSTVERVGDVETSSRNFVDSESRN